MQIPSGLAIALQQLQSKMSGKPLAKISAELSASYISRDKVGGRVVTDIDQAAVYAMARMPATCCAISSALEHSVVQCDIAVDSLLDVGAGTGAATWAVGNLFNPKEITCLEREKAMSQVGSEFTSGNSEFMHAKWVAADMVKDKLPTSADLVIAGYALNELTPQDREKVAVKLWESTQKVLLIVEPGTPECYGQLIAVRDKLLKIGAKMLAPCTHSDICKLERGDWCHFTCRVARSKMHKMLKGGDCPYEDEKYCYMAFSRDEYKLANARVLRHPIIEKQRVTLRLCTAAGIVGFAIKKSDGEIYKAARKADAGDDIKVSLCKEQ